MDWNVNWDDLTRVYLHDPPDKILDLATHVGRAREYARTVLGKDFPEGEIYELADQLSSALERMPAPSSQTLVIGPSDGKLLVYHPLTGRAESPEPDWLDLPNLEPRRIQEVLEQLTRDLSQPEKFLALWRLLPERLSEIHPSYLRLPADTRCPDHTIWHHLDICAAVFAAETGGQGPAFLSFALGPVQQFIATARSLRDLWSGSMILSWLTFRAMLPIIEACGPTSIIYPALRGIPLLDLWLRRRSARLAQLIPQPSVEMRQAPCLPNRFLALVPYGPDGEYANGLAQRCEQALRQAWRELTDAVHYALDPILSSLDNDWDKRWQAQLDSFWDIRTAVLPWRALSDNELAELICGVAEFGEAFPDAQKVRQLAESIPQEQRPKFAQNQAGCWQARQELSARLMQALRAVRHVPTYSPLTDGTWVPPKCSLMGTYEQMGPDGLDASREFWRQAEKKLIVGGVRLRRAERLCAVALVKRFAAPAFFLRELELTRQDLRFADIASVALAEWLLRFGKLQNYSKERLDSTWVYWQHNYKVAETAEDEDEEVVEPVPDDIWQELRICRRRVPPPTYYAILMMDGDHMGSWLRGDMSPRVRDVLHPELVAYYERLGGPVAHLLEAKRPIGPALHAALSTALSNFALH
ncbi:MAG: hypothetical protein NZ914_14560, partial [Gemmatales bacterium]|nr:hypothetical protein [Gemmatales bacterium]